MTLASEPKQGLLCDPVAGLWLWSLGGGILALESWFENPGYGNLAMGAWLWNPLDLGSGFWNLAVESSL